MKTMILEIMDFIAKERPLIVQAPVLAVGGAAGVAVTAFGLGYLLKKLIDDGRLSANQERLELARERQGAAEDRLKDLEKQIGELQSAIAEKAPDANLEEKSKDVGAALVAARQANNAVHYVLIAEPGNYGIGSGEGSFGS